MAELLEPKEIIIADMKGRECTYILSHIPFLPGREIAAQYILSSLPKLGDYKTNEEMMAKILSFAAVKLESGAIQRLNTPELLNNHIYDWETGRILEARMMDYNCTFFQQGRAWIFFVGIVQKSLPKIFEMLTTLQPQSSQTSTQP